MKSAHHIFSMHREHRRYLSSPRGYMYVVSAKIACFPLNLSPSQSYYQDGHDDTSESRGVFDEERSSYFLHAPSASGYFSTRPSPVTYMYVVSAKITCFPLKLSPSQSYYQHGHCGISETSGVFDEERSSYFFMYRVLLEHLSTRASPAAICTL